MVIIFNQCDTLFIDYYKFDATNGWRVHTEVTRGGLRPVRPLGAPTLGGGAKMGYYKKI